MSLALLLAAVVCPPGCGDSTSQASSKSGTAVIQVTDLPFSDLHSLTLTITRVRLFSTVDDAPVDVFPSSESAGTAIVVDLVALDGLTGLLAVSDVPAGEFSAAEITFSSASATAGSPPLPQTVTPNSGAIRIDFAEPRLASADEFTPILLDFDGEASVARGSDAVVAFSPTIFEVGGDARSQVSGLRGTVAELGAGPITVAFDDGTAGAAAIGQLPVFLGVSSVLRVDGESFSGPSGLSRVAVGDRAEVSGRLGRDGIEADLLQVDRINDLNEKRTVRLRGTVTGLSPLTIEVNAIERDLNGVVQRGQTITVRFSPSATISSQTGAGPVNLSAIFPGQEVEVVGPLVDQVVTADLVVMRESRVSGTLSAFNVPLSTGTLALTEVNGGPAVGLPPAVTLALFSAEGTLGQTSPLDLSRFSAGQEVLATGSFVHPPSNIGPAVFSVSELSLEDLQDFEALPSSTDLAAGTFNGTAGGSPVTVVLSESTRLAVRRTGVPDRIFNVGREEFLNDLALISGTGTVSVRGFLSGGQIQAIRAVVTITVP